MTAATILVVEDNSATRKLYRLTLQAAGYTVIEAADGLSALEMVATHGPDLVLQDLMLPGLGGLELSRRIRDLPGRRDTPIIAVSGFQSLVNEISAGAGDVDASLLKPVEPERLIETVKAFLPPPVDAGTLGRGRRVLIVDDDPVQLKLARLRLRAAGFEAVGASDGAAALEAARRQRPDVILSDVLMPKLDGFDLCLAVRRDPDLAGVAVVLTSAHYDEHRDVELSRKVGANALVVRTADFEPILAAIDRALGGLPPAAEGSTNMLREEHHGRVAQQLRRQTALNTALLRRCAQQAAQLSILGGVAHALAQTADLDATLGDVLASCLDAGGISKGAICRANGHGGMIATHLVGFAESERGELEAAVAAMDLGSPSLARAAAPGSGSGVVADRLLHHAGLRVGVAVPLVSEGQHKGALFLGSNVEGAMHADVLAFARAVASQIAQATTLMAVFERLATLAAASQVLSGRLDLDAALQQLAETICAHVADVCEIHVVDRDGKPRRAGLSCHPARAEVAAALARHDPSVPISDPDGAALRDGAAQLDEHLDDGWRVRTSSDPERLRLHRALELHSRVVVPLIQHGRLTGSLGLATFRPGRGYGRADLLMAEDLARRTAITIENVRLYHAVADGSRAKDEFLATVSHELRTPLNAMLGWAALLRKQKPDERKLDHGLETIERNARAQGKLIDDMLDVSRIISGKLALQLRMFQLRPVLQATIDVLFPTSSAKQVAITLDCHELVGELRGDPERLQQVVWNLLSNAVKFTPRGGRVDVTASLVGSAVEICVADTGAGIRPEFLPYIFDRFTQDDSSTTRNYGGLGLGLALARHMVELHGGTVRADSDGEGRGARFTIRLPLVAVRTSSSPAHLGTTAQHEAAGHPAADDALAGMRILVVDDEADARELLSLLLERHGAEVVTAASASDGIAAFARFQPGIVLSDLGMPGEDGFSFVARLRAMSSVPAVAVTAYASLEDVRRTERAGFQRHLAKPIDPAELVEAVLGLTRAR